MKHLVKAAAAAALLMGAGAANARINYFHEAQNETFLSAYDIVNGKTFNFDTEIPMQYWYDGARNPASMSKRVFDLSNDRNWQNFITGAAKESIVFVVAVGHQNAPINYAVTSHLPLTTDPQSNAKIPGSLEAKVIDFNAKGFEWDAAGRPGHFSSLVLDTEPSTMGRYANGKTLWGSWPSNPAGGFEGGYGEVNSVKFWLGEFFAFVHPNNLDNIDENDDETLDIFRNDVTELGTWTMAGNSLTFTPVPVPAAVWMFGTGLLGLLGLSRRKAA